MSSFVLSLKYLKGFKEFPLDDKLTLLSLLLSTAGRCLANQMFTLWRREEEEHREQPRLTE